MRWPMRASTRCWPRAWGASYEPANRRLRGLIMRKIVLDTETTGLEPEGGHRIIEIGCVEVVNRRLTGNDLHLYLNPDREIDEGAQAVHGISTEFLADKPRFADIADELDGYLGEAELVIHNAPFDLGFLNAELRRVDPERPALETRNPVLDTLVEARRRFPGQRNSLDALCNRFGVDDSARELHGALLDAQLLADVYLAMTGGQTSMAFGGDRAAGAEADGSGVAQRLAAAGQRPRIVTASAQELQLHREYLDRLQQTSAQGCLWHELEPME